MDSKLAKEYTIAGGLAVTTVALGTVSAVCLFQLEPGRAIVSGGGALLTLYLAVDEIKYILETRKQKHSADGPSNE